MIMRKPKTPMQDIAELSKTRIDGRLSNAEIKKRMKRIDDDFQRAFRLLRKHPDTVSFFGSSKIDSSSKYYEQARSLAHKIVCELRLTVVSGGGPGIMEAANRGAREAQGDSLGMDIELPNEQVKNGYVTHSADFYYFFSRKVALTFTARAYVFFPGGYGTLDELFEILTLKQTGKIPAIPVVLVGTDYWKPLCDFLKNVVQERAGTLTKDDLSLYITTDDQDKIVDILAGKVKV